MTQLRDSGALSSAERPCVALLCPEPRLRRILALALETDGLLVCDCPLPGQPSESDAAVVVADLDSLGWDATEAVRRLGVATPLLLISVYPQHLDDVNTGRFVAALQPPFRWRDFSWRVRCLLRAAQHA
jgi:hypothetical protein